MQDEKLKLEDLLEKTYVASDGSQINSVVIIGAGIMGQGIAQTVAAAGMDVLIVEKDEKHLRKSKHSLAESIDREIKRWAMTSSEKKSIMSRISWEINLDKINDFDLIIESVDEENTHKLAPARTETLKKRRTGSSNLGRPFAGVAPGRNHHIRRNGNKTLWKRPRACL